MKCEKCGKEYDNEIEETNCCYWKHYVDDWRDIDQEMVRKIRKTDSIEADRVVRAMHESLKEWKEKKW